MFSDHRGGTVIEKFVRVLDRGRWYLLALWLAVLAVAAVVGWPLKDQLSGGGWEVRGSQAQHVLDAERSGFLGRGSTTLTAVVHDDRFGKDAPQFAERARRVFDDLQREPDLKITSRYGWSTLPAPPRDRFVGSDGRTAVESVALDLDDGTARRILPDIQKRIADRFRGEGLRVSLVGGSSFWGEINKLSAKGLARAELVTLPLILVILLLLFRSVVASIVSLSVGVTAVAVTFAVLAVLSRHFELSIFVQNAATMLGLGIGIDY
jgi:RND superfamily putative drug exporter